MNERFAQGDPGIWAGMRQTWEHYNALPADGRPPEYALDDAEREFIKQAMTIRYKNIQAGP